MWHSIFSGRRLFVALSTLLTVVAFSGCSQPVPKENPDTDAGHTHADGDDGHEGHSHDGEDGHHHDKDGNHVDDAGAATNEEGSAAPAGDTEPAADDADPATSKKPKVDPLDVDGNEKNIEFGDPAEVELPK